MSDIIPNTIIGKIEFFEQRLTDWAAAPEAIGLTAQQVADQIARASAARSAYTAAQQARQESRNATAVQNDAVNDMASSGSDLIATIRAFAELQPDPNAVFQTAEINPPTPAGTPLPPPVPATDVTPTLLTSGAIRISWKGTTANGTFYDVYRELEAGSGFTLIGSSATRSLDDANLPVGTTRATYYCVSRRDAFSSEPSIPGLIRFGTQAQPGSGSNQLGLAA